MVLELISNLFDLSSKLGLTRLRIIRLGLNRSGLSLGGPPGYLLIHRISWRGHFLLRLVDIVFTKMVSNYGVAVVNQLVAEIRRGRDARQVIWNHNYFFVLDIPLSNMFVLDCDRL